MGEEFNTEQFIQNLWERENLQGLKQVNGKGGYRNGRYFPYQGTNGVDIGPGFLLKSQSPAFQKKARTVGLTKKELDDSVRSSIKESMSIFDKRIRKEGGNPNVISNNVRMGLLDMNWQLGKDQFMGQYNKFWKAVANGDYEGMRRESRTTWQDKKGKHLDKARWDFRKNTYFQDPEPLVPVVNTSTYIAQPDALRVARPLVPPAVPEVHNVPFISVAPNAYAEGGMLYGNEEQMPDAPQGVYQDDYQNNDATPQETPRQWDELSLSEKNAFIASAVKHGITSMEDIKRAYNELSQGQMDVAPEEPEEDGNKFLKGGYKPSRSIKNYIANKEGASMKTNRSFEEEAQSFWSVLPKEVRSKLTQEQADALYSYSYNVGAGNFKHRVVPALQRYFSGIGSMEDVQRHMYATKDSQLRGLANRRAEERAMFAGSKVPVYYDAPDNTTNNASNVNMNNTWRSSRLGPVNSINVSRGLGVVNNDGLNNNGFSNNALLGPVNNISQDAPMMSEEINTLYDDTNPTLMEVPQEEQSSLDRYNAIQDYLSSLNPFGYARGGRMYDKGGVTSSNGQYHVEPSEYSEVLDSTANGNPLEVTLPDTTVTAADPRNYRSYYDPNGAGEFMDATTLGLFPNPFNLSRSASSFMQKPSWDLAWDTIKDALMFAGSTGKEAALAPLGIMNLMDKDGVRKTYGLAKDGNYARAIMSGLGDALNAGMVMNFSPSRNKGIEVESPVLLDFGSTKDGSFKFDGFIEDPLQMHLKRAKAKGYDTSGINIYNLSESTPENEELINALAHQYGLSPKETLDFLLKHLDAHGHGATFKGTKIIIHDGKSPNQSAINSHEADHLLHTPKEPLPDNVFYPRIKNIHGDYFIKDNNTEVAARGSQLRDYFGHTGAEPLTKEDLLYAKSNYSKDTGIDNEMSEMLWSTKDFDTLADWMSKYSTGVIPLGLMGTNYKSK